MSENEKKPNEELNEESLEQVSGGYSDTNRNVPDAPPQCPKQHSYCTKDNCLNANCGFLIQTQQSYYLEYTCGKNFYGTFTIYL